MGRGLNNFLQQDSFTVRNGGKHIKKKLRNRALARLQVPNSSDFVVFIYNFVEKILRSGMGFRMYRRLIFFGSFISVVNDIQNDVSEYCVLLKRPYKRRKVAYIEIWLLFT